jgi:deoxyadenosine/deoxycytidine kinase
VLEGNIASGKSTIIKIFETHKDLINLKLNLFTEPVDKWCNLEGHNLLDKMYSNPNRWAYALNSYISLTMFERHVELNRSLAKITMMERSIYSSNYCFVKYLYEK